MKRLSLPLLACLTLAGCAASRTDINLLQGDYSRGASPAQTGQLAADAVRQLSLLAPPAATRLEFSQPITDAFGKSLVEALRIRGYAVSERPAQRSTDAPPSKTATAARPAPASGEALPIAYLVDQIPEPSLYRVTLILGKQSVTRGYLARGNAMHPVGAWVRKE